MYHLIHLNNVKSKNIEEKNVHRDCGTIFEVGRCNCGCDWVQAQVFVGMSWISVLLSPINLTLALVLTHTFHTPTPSPSSPNCGICDTTHRLILNRLLLHVWYVLTEFNALLECGLNHFYTFQIFQTKKYSS
jgi:hypothetical protein